MAVDYVDFCNAIVFAVALALYYACYVCTIGYFTFGFVVCVRFLSVKCIKKSIIDGDSLSCFVGCHQNYR